jgi:hypothetical protein
LKIVDAALLGVVLSRAKKQELTESISYYRDYRNYRDAGPTPGPTPALEPQRGGPPEPPVRDDLPH